MADRASADTMVVVANQAIASPHASALIVRIGGITMVRVIVPMVISPRFAVDRAIKTPVPKVEIGIGAPVGAQVMGATLAVAAIAREAMGTTMVVATAMMAAAVRVMEGIRIMAAETIETAAVAITMLSRLKRSSALRNVSETRNQRVMMLRTSAPWWPTH